MLMEVIKVALGSSMGRLRRGPVRRSTGSNTGRGPGRLGGIEEPDHPDSGVRADPPASFVSSRRLGWPVTRSRFAAW
jgi:hypothetical protein